MDEPLTRKSFTCSNAPRITVLENAFITRYMMDAEGAFVKAYIYGLMTTQTNDYGHPIPIDDDTLLRAFTYWQQRGLVKVTSTDPLCVEYLPLEVVQQAAADDGGIRRTPSSHEGLVGGLACVLSGRILTTNELRYVYDWSDVFGFSDDAIKTLVKHCIDTTCDPKVSIRYMDAAAKSWADSGVKTQEDALKHLKAYDERFGGAAKVLKVWRQTGAPTEPQMELYDKWTRGWGFSEEAVIIASRQTANSAKPTFKYLDAILEDYKAKGLMSETLINEHNALREKRAGDVRAKAKLIFGRAGIKRSPTKEDKDQVEIWLYDWLIDPEVMFFAAECAASASMPFSYMKKLAADYHKSGINTLAQARARHEEFAAKLNQPQKSQAATGWEHAQRDYSKQEMDDLLTRLRQGENKKE